ncbi:unnamed protein product [Sphagnum troendelagicum]
MIGIILKGLGSAILKRLGSAILKRLGSVDPEELRPLPGYLPSYLHSEVHRRSIAISLTMKKLIEDRLKEDFKAANQIINEFKKCRCDTGNQYNSNTEIDHSDNEDQHKQIEIEIEIRYNTKDIDVDAFMKAYNSIEAKKEVTNVEYAVYNNLKNDKVRIIRRGKKDPIYMKKEKLLATNSPFNEFPFKLVVSSERIITVNSDKKYDRELVRRRERKSIEYKPDGKVLYTTFFTIVNRTDYEIEIEIKPEVIKQCLKDEHRNVLEKLAGYIVSTSNKYFGNYQKCNEIKQSILELGIEFNKPVIYRHNTLLTDDNGNLTRSYWMTYKLDGLRSFVIIKGSNVFTMDMQDNVRKIGVADSTSGITILDAEIYKDKVYPFDVLYNESTDLRNLKFEERLQTLRQIVESHEILKKKRYMKFSNFTEYKKALTQLYVNNKTKLMDGIIIVDANSTYRDRVYKWKEFPTVDLTVMKNQVYCVSHDVLHQYKDLPLTEKLDEENQSKVCEFKIVDEGLVFLRRRDDKDQPNSLRTVISTVKEATSARTTVNDLLNETPYIYRKACNLYKTNIISKLTGVCLDIGTGHGSDIFKYFPTDSGRPPREGVTTLYCIEPDEESYKVLVKKIRENKTLSSLGTKIRHRQLKAQNIQKLVPFGRTAPPKFSNVTMFFVINRMKSTNITRFATDVAPFMLERGSLHIIMMCSEAIKSNIAKLGSGIAKLGSGIAKLGSGIAKLGSGIAKLECKEPSSVQKVDSSGIRMKVDWEKNKLHLDLNSPTVKNVKENLYSSDEVQSLIESCGYKMDLKQVLNTKFFMSTEYVSLMNMYVYMKFLKSSQQTETD